MKKQELIEVLKAVKPGLASKEIIEQSYSFIFTKNKVSTYNDEIMITHPIDLSFEGVVRAEELYKLLSNIKEENIDISQNGSELLLYGKRFKSGLPIEPDIKLPISEIKISAEWKPLPKDFCNGIKFCLFSIGTDYSNPILTCIHIRKKVVESSDNFRITQYNMENGIVDSLLIPFVAAKKIINYSPIKYQKTENGWINFKNDKGVVFSCRTYTQEYPNTSPFMSIKGHRIKFPSSLIDSLLSAEVLCEEDITGDKFILIEMEGRQIIVKGQSQKGWYEEKFRMKEQVSKYNISFETNSRFFRDILSHLGHAIIDREETKMKFIGKNFIHILKLIETK